MSELQFPISINKPVSWGSDNFLMFAIRKPSILRNTAVYSGITLILVIYFFAYVRIHQEDLRIYLQASEAIKSGQDIYFLTSNQYVYGPFLALLLLPLTILEADLAKLFWGIANLFSVFVIVFLINKLRIQKNRSVISYPVLCAFFLTSFSYRNNLGQGQAIAFVLIFWLLIVLLSKSSSNLLLRYFAMSALTIAVLEVKLYLGLGLLLYFVILKNYKYFLTLGFTLLLIQLLYQKYLAVDYFSWIDSLKLRSKSVMDGNDQASLLSLLKVNFALDNVSAITTYVLFLIVIMFFLVKRRQSIIMELESFTMIIPLVIFPFMHAHDLLLGLAGLALAFDFRQKITRTQGLMLFSLFVLHVGWTSDVIIGGLLILGILVFSLWMGIDCLKFGLATLAFLLGSALLMILHFAFSIGDYSRIRAYNFLALIEGVLLFLQVYLIAKVQKDEMSDLSLSRDNIRLDT